jgi:hypothetical protein
MDQTLLLMPQPKKKKFLKTLQKNLPKSSKKLSQNVLGLCTVTVCLVAKKSLERKKTKKRKYNIENNQTHFCFFGRNGVIFFV